MGDDLVKPPSRVLLVADSHKWCFGHMAKGIQRYAPRDYLVTVMDGTEFCDLQKKNGRWHEQFDAMCQFSWAEASYRVPIRNTVVVAHEGCMYPYPMPSDSEYLESLTTPLRNQTRAELLLPGADNVIFFTEKMQGAFPSIKSRVVHPAVDPAIFRPQRLARKTEKFTVGWCAQRNVRHKGDELLQEIISRLAETHPGEFNIEILDTRATDEDVLSQEDMASWYGQLDAFICTAASEGGPLPVLEAMACGVPAISTRVGVAGEYATYVTGSCIESGQVEARAAEFCDILVRLKSADHAFRDFKTRSYMALVPTWKTHSKKWLDAIYESH